MDKCKLSEAQDDWYGWQRQRCTASQEVTLVATVVLLPCLQDDLLFVDVIEVDVMGSPTWKERVSSLAIADLKAKRKEYVWSAPQWLGVTDVMSQHLLHDPRDAPAMWLVLNVITLVLPAATLLHAHPEAPHWVGAAYLVLNYALFLQVGSWAPHAVHMQHMRPKVTLLPPLALVLLGAVCRIPYVATHSPQPLA